jgi:hypothetical protein
MEKSNRELFAAIRDHLNQADLSNSEQFDKAILTLSSGGLGLSIAIIQFIVPLSEASCFLLLWASWFLFGLAIVTTVVSFMTTKEAINETRYYAYQYYMEYKEEYAEKISPYSRLTYNLNKASGVLFILAIISIVAFVSINIDTDGKEVTEKSSKTQNSQTERGYVPPTVKPKPPKSEQQQQQKPKEEKM